eukprot:458545-Hanusia_phi.AAC.1
MSAASRRSSVIILNLKLLLTSEVLLLPVYTTIKIYTVHNHSSSLADFKHLYSVTVVPGRITCPTVLIE